MFRVKKVEFENVFLFKGRFNVDFPERGLFLIEGVNLDSGGSNGAGKTSLLNLIPTALFENNGSGLVKDLVVNKFSDAGWIRVYFDGYCVEYRRVLRGSGKSDWFIMKDGQRVRGSSLTDTKWLVGEILGFSYEQYSSIVHLRQGSTIGFWDFSPSERVRMISNLLNLEIFEQASQHARENCNVILRDMEGVKGEIQMIERNIKEVEDAIKTREACLIDVDVLKNERMRLEGEVEKKSALLKDLLQQLGKLELSLKSLRVERERLARLVEEKGRYLNEFQRNIKRSRDILFEIERLHKEEENLLVRLQKLEADFNEGMLSEARNAVDILRVEEGRILAKLDELRRIKGLKMSDNCPVCGRPLSAEIIRDRMVHIEKETGDLEKQLANVRLQIKNLSDKIAGFEQRRMERQELLSRLEGVRRFLSTSREAEVRAVVERGSDEVERITKEIEDLEGQLSALKKDEEYNEEFWRIKRQVVSLEHEIAELNGELNEINRKIVEQENCRNLIDEYKGRLAVLQRDLQIKMDGLKAFEDSYGYMKWWVDGFKRFQILEIANAIDVLQERLSYYSLMLFEDRMSIKIDVLEQKKTKKDVFDFKNEIHFRINDGVIPFSGFSGGEKQLLALVFLMSVNDLFGFEFVILDEVFGSLDELNRERVLRLLKDISQRKLVLVVTHIDDVKNAADWDGFIKVIRQNGCSSVVLE